MRYHFVIGGTINEENHDVLISSVYVYDFFNRL